MQINRRKDGRSKRDLFDVIGLLKETDPELIPIFVARDLQKLPPVHFDHVDPTKLLKDMLVIQSELKKIKESYITEEKFTEVKNELANLKNASLVNVADYVSKKMDEGSYISDGYSLNSRMAGLPAVAEQNQTERSESSPRATRSEPAGTSGLQRPTRAFQR